MSGDPRVLEVRRLVAARHPRSDLRPALAEALLSRLPSDDDATVEELAVIAEEMSDLVERRTETTAVRVHNPGGEARGTVVVVHTDDAPFLFTSVRNEIRAHGLGVARALHPVIGVERDTEGRLIAVLPARTASRRESVQWYELDRRLADIDLPAFERAVRRVVGEVRRAVDDFEAMRAKVEAMRDLVRQGGEALGVPPGVVDEYVSFLDWLLAGNFVFLGYREYRLVDAGGGAAVEVVPGSGLGILADTGRSRFARPVPLDDLPAGVADRYRHGDLLVVSKAGSMTTVQRWDRMDYVGVRLVHPSGETAGEARLLGLFSTKALLEPSFRVPILRRLFADVLAAEDIIEGSHDHRAMIQLFDGLPKSDLFAARVEDLRRLLSRLLTLGEHEEVSLFVRPDAYERRFSVLLAMPRDRFSGALRQRIQALLVDRLGGTSSDYHLALGEGAEAFLHFTIWVDTMREVRLDELENDVLDLVRGWEDRVLAELTRRVGRAAAVEAFGRWGERFPDYYRDFTEPGVAAADILNLDRLAEAEEVVGIHNESGPRSDGRLLTRVSLYRRGAKRPLSDLVHPLEDHGLRVVEEVPTRLSGADDVFIHDFGVVGPDGHRLDIDACGERLEASLAAVWEGRAESDALSALVVTGGLDPLDVEILRAYRTYWPRIRPIYTAAYIDSILVGRPPLTALIVELFRALFERDSDEAALDEIRQRIAAAVDGLPTYDEDLVFRALVSLVEATVRTNAFLADRGPLALKLRSADIPDIPSPVPYREIFVFGPDVEGIHLRAAPVARGGIRWSDRREDYRTEILGLMRAQMRKNVLIVPGGAKGGFVLRRDGDPAAAYVRFIGALLDVTDDRRGGEVVHPPGVVCRDGDDAYLVVAPDRGTGAFSDLANAVAVRRGFWLGDAFASGGKTGYDHKALGITARGAWVALLDHLGSLGRDPDEGVTVVGVGDMSGDVFGNAMILSDRIRLVAAFDHRHVFVDPDPDPAVSWKERARLFSLPGSSWADYDRSVLSPGGGIWARTEKRVDLSAEARRALGVEDASLHPDELVRAILAAPVDVFFNGGIGTFVKASSESHREVDDRANDGVRVDAADLRCRIVVEGGNLGLTQAARVEFALAGGLVNTDFVDNSGGVDCSDREVNLKILLDLAVSEGVVDPDRRNAVIAAASAEVVDAVLTDSARQVRALTREAGRAPGRRFDYGDLVSSLSEEGILDRRLEGIPDPVRTDRALVRPELAILLADAKRSLERALLGTTLPSHPLFEPLLARAFPPSVVRAVGPLVGRHPLRRELVATILANEIVDSEGPTFIPRVCRETGADVAAAVVAYGTARAVTEADEWRGLVDETPLDATARLGVESRIDRLVAAVTRWYIAHRSDSGAGADVAAARRAIDECLAAVDGPPEWTARRDAEAAALAAAGAPEPTARRLALLPVVGFLPDALDVAAETGRPLSEVLGVFVAAGPALGLDALAEALPAEEGGRWEGWALHAVEDEMSSVRRRFAEEVLALHGDSDDPVAAFLSGRSQRLGRLVRLRRALGEIPAGDIDRLVVALAHMRAVVEMPG